MWPQGQKYNDFRGQSNREPAGNPRNRGNIRDSRISYIYSVYEYHFCVPNPASIYWRAEPSQEPRIHTVIQAGIYTREYIRGLRVCTRFMHTTFVGLMRRVYTREPWATNSSRIPSLRIYTREYILTDQIFGLHPWITSFYEYQSKYILAFLSIYSWIGLAYFLWMTP